MISEEEIVTRFDGERKDFVTAIFDHSKTAVKWTTVNIEAVMAGAGSDRQRILSALEYFHEKGWIDLQPKSGVEVFDILKPEFDLDSTAQELADLFAGKEQKDVLRLHTMIDMFESGKCLARELSAYFGETLAKDCGRCSNCKGQGPVRLPSQVLPRLDDLPIHSIVQGLMEALPGPLTINLVTRFLCGIISPRLIQYKAKQIPGFGRLDAYPYKTVEIWVDGYLKKLCGSSD